LPSPIPGLEVAGTIVACGEASGQWQVGDEVCALGTGGGYAQYCAAPAPQCLPVPKSVGVIDSAAMPETFFTVWQNLFVRGRLVSGESVLIHGGSSGIGTPAIQIAHAIGATVFVPAGSAEKCAACRSLGADHAIEYRTEDFVAAVSAATTGRGVDAILDIVGGDYFARNLQCLALDGRLIQIAMQDGATVELDLATLPRGGITITGSAMRPRSVAQKGVIATGLRERVWPLVESGRVKPVIYRRFPLAQAADAHRLMESSDRIGKIVLTM